MSAFGKRKLTSARLTTKADPLVWLHNHAVLHLVYVLARRLLHRRGIASASGVEQLIGLGSGPVNLLN